MTTNFGLVGYGLWGKHHARAIRASPHCRLAAIACASAATAAIARSDFPDVPVVISYQALLDLSQVDAVDIVVPNHLHAEIATAALASGRNVLLEKPLALTLAECDRIIEAEHQARHTLSVVHQFRLSTQWGRIKTMIDAGDIGEPRYANVSLFRFPFRPGSDGWRYQRSRVGSWILEEPVHFFDSVMWYFDSLGDPISVSAVGNSRQPEAGLVDNFSCALRWLGGAYATITQTLTAFENHQTVEVVGTQGSIRAWWSGASDRTPHPTFELKHSVPGGTSGEVVDIGPSGEVVELAETFARIDSVFSTHQPLVSAKEARKRIVVCLEAERALTSEMPVSLSF